MSNTQQADSELHQDQLLNFLVDTLNQEVAPDLAANAQIDAQDIYKVLVGACADWVSISTLCNSSKNSPAANTVLYHLRTILAVIMRVFVFFQIYYHQTRPAQATRRCRVA